MHHVDAHGAKIPALGMGTWTLRDRQCSELVEAALRLGYRHLDTAAMYGNEEAVGKGLRGSAVDRDDVFLTTKVWWTDLAGPDLRKSAEASLRRLGVGHVDLLLIHWPNPRVPLGETVAALNEVREAGMTRHIGVSNFPTDLLDEAARLSAAPLVVNQVENHPFLNQDKVLAACRARQMAMVSYCPLYRGGEVLSLPEVQEPARRLGRTPGQIVLRWHVQQHDVVAIPRTSRAERLKENFAVFDFELSADEMAAISALRKAGRRLCDFEFGPRWDGA